MDDRTHWADKPILRDFFWFLVLPHQFKQWLQNSALPQQSIGDQK